MLIALVLYDGVLDAECVAFRSVLERVTDAEFTTVAATAGTVRGPGGVQLAEVSFGDFIANPHPLEVIVVPGGIGCERAAENDEFRRFLQTMGDRARLIAASSTGSVILASAGLLRGEPAATHWLAESLLQRYGSELDRHQMAIHGNVITCEGRISAVDAAFAIVERIENPKAAVRIREELLQAGAPLLAEPTLVQRIFNRIARLLSDRSPPLIHDPPASVMIELVDDPTLARRIRDNADRRPR